MLDKYVLGTGVETDRIREPIYGIFIPIIGYAVILYYDFSRTFLRYRSPWLGIKAEKFPVPTDSIDNLTATESTWQTPEQIVQESSTKM